MDTHDQPASCRIDEVLTLLSSGSHRAGTLKTSVLKDIIQLLPSRDILSLETGCGKSTVAFSNIAKRHMAFCYDDRDLPDSSVKYVVEHEYFISERTSFVFGPTQVTLPQHNFGDDLFDLILIDGPHGFPFPDLEYWHLYPRLAPGALLVIDDLMIPSIGRMYDILREDRMFSEVAVLATTGILRRSHECLLPRDGDHWWEQAYNFRRFPISMQPYKKDASYTFGTELDFAESGVSDRYCVRGFQFRAGDGAVTIDTSAVVRLMSDAPAGTHLRITMCIQVASLKDCDGGSIHVNEALMMTIPADLNQVNVEFSCPAAPHGDYWIEFRMPAAKPIHDTKGNLNFRRAGLTLRHLSVRLDSANDNPMVISSSQVRGEGPIGSHKVGVQLSVEGTLEASDFISTLRRLADTAGITLRESTKPHEIVPAPILCPDPASAVRLLPLKGTKQSRNDGYLGRMLPLDGKNWTFVDFFAFEGEEFSYAVLRSLLFRVPTKKQIQIGVAGTTAEKVFLVLETDYRARKIGGPGRFTDLFLTRVVYRIWRAAQKLKLPVPNSAFRRFIERSARICHEANRSRVEERRMLLNALTVLSRGR